MFDISIIFIDYKQSFFENALRLKKVKKKKQLFDVIIWYIVNVQLFSEELHNILESLRKAYIGQIKCDARVNIFKELKGKASNRS